MKDTTLKKYESPAYWTQLLQLMIFNHVREFMEKEGLTQKEFSERLGVSKGYVSQILNGDFDHRLSKLVELTLACGLVPKLELIPIAKAQDVVETGYYQPVEWNSYEKYSAEISLNKRELWISPSNDSKNIA